MQPLLRYAPRSLFKSIRIIGPSRPTRDLSTRSVVKPSICMQCQFRHQLRHFADNTKPIPPSTATNNGLSDSSLPSPELPSAEEGRRSAASKNLSHLMDNLQGNIFIASQRLNDLTGYSGIEALKARISRLEDDLAKYQEAVRVARQTYKQTVADRAASQREVTTLLARKDTWTPADLERFTSLYRSDHGNEQAVQEAATRLADVERVAEQAANKLSTSILSRYHEEQIWSDKIRRMSTWGTWGLMGVNVLIFLVFQFGFEPWRRRRLVRGFEEKVHEALEREKAKQALGHGRQGTDAEQEKGSGADKARLNALVSEGMQELEIEMNDSGKADEPAVSALAAVIKNDAKEEKEEKEPFISSSWSDRWTAGLLDLFSHRVVSLRKQDVTIIALEGAATGATVVGLIMFALRQN